MLQRPAALSFNCKSVPLTQNMCSITLYPMSIWQRLKRLQADSQQKNKYTYISGEIPKLDSTNPVAQENPNLDETTSNSQAVSLSGDQTNELYQWWIMLSPREQDVTALTCLKYTNSQIAAHLGLSIYTVNTYIEKVLTRFGLQSKADLRVVFANWDFSAWEKRKPQR